MASESTRSSTNVRVFPALPAMPLCLIDCSLVLTSLPLQQVVLLYMLNRKLIGAKYFNKGHLAYAKSINVTVDPIHNSARDIEGHGTHTLSTAGGNFVSRANVFGFGEGTTKGGSPEARVASYKVCWTPLSPDDGGCWDADIIAAVDHAIYDAVDILSASLAGNDGPHAGSVSNNAPWLLTVGASTMDREFISHAILGNNESFKGDSISPNALKGKTLCPLISGANAKASNASADIASPLGYVTPAQTLLNTKPAPYMASFSSEGPNPITPGILKPDITAPGKNVLAAYTLATSPTGLDNEDKRRVLFNVVSGTSMSCPHMSGIVGLLKTLHPDWSPAAIKSAVMTSRNYTRQQ